MRLVIVAAGLILCACNGSADDASRSDITDIKAAVDQWETHYNARDWAALGLLYTEDAVLLPPDTGPKKGREAIAEYSGSFTGEFSIKLTVDDIIMEKDTAIIYGRSCLILGPEDDRVYDPGSFIEVRKRDTGGNWPIVLDMFNSDLPSLTVRSCIE